MDVADSIVQHSQLVGRSERGRVLLVVWTRLLCYSAARCGWNEGCPAEGRPPSLGAPQYDANRPDAQRPGLDAVTIPQLPADNLQPTKAPWPLARLFAHFKHRCRILNSRAGLEVQRAAKRADGRAVVGAGSLPATPSVLALCRPGSAGFSTWHTNPSREDRSAREA